MPSQKEARTREERLVRCLLANDRILASRGTSSSSSSAHLADKQGRGQEQDKEQDKEKGLESALRVAREALVSCKLSSGGMASSLYGAHRYNDGALALRTRTTTTTPVRVKMEGGRGMGRRCVLVEEEEEEEGRREEALKCFSGMPTPALRNAQRRFREALSAAIEVVNAQLQASGLREDYAAEYGSHKEDEGSSGSEQTAVGG